MLITPYTDDRYDEVVAFVSRLNDNPADHIGYLEQGEQQLVHDLAELSAPMRVTFQLAVDEGELVGVMGYDADPTLGKVWLLGPFVDHPDWYEVADALYTAVLESLPEGLDQLELFGNTENRNLEQFAQAHEFRPLVAAHLLKLGRPAVRPSTQTEVRDFEAEMAADVTTLHETVFPNTYYSVEQLIEMRDETHQLLVYLRQDQVVGYAFLQFAPEVGRAYLDFIGVTPEARGSGVGRKLLDAVIDRAFAPEDIDRLELTVNADNKVALHLYQSAGFAIVETMRGYRRSRVAAE